jgi:very-short-patch-repair endonuclease
MAHRTPIGPFHAGILGFSEKLVIEVDGDTHAYAEERDAVRMAMIAAEGHRIIRVTNNEVMQNLDGVPASIANSLSSREREGPRSARDGWGHRQA